MKPETKNFWIAYGALVRKARAENDWSLEEMASKVECSVTHLSRIERGLTGLKLGLASRIARSLHMSIDYMFEEAAGLPHPSPPDLTREILENLHD